MPADDTYLWHLGPGHSVSSFQAVSFSTFLTCPFTVSAPMSTLIVMFGSQHPLEPVATTQFAGSSPLRKSSTNGVVCRDHCSDAGASDGV